MFHPLLEVYPTLGVLLVITAVLMSIASALSSPFANVMLVLTPIISVFAIVSALLLLRISCSGLECIVLGSALIFEGLVAFLGIVILPIAWARRVSDSSDIKVLLTKSLIPGLLSLLVFWGFWVVSTYPLTSSIP